VDRQRILELYLNNVFCGHGRYEVKACSQYYFRKAPDGRQVKVQETGGRNALPVFIKTMRTVYRNRLTEQFPEATDPKKPFLFFLPWSPSPLAVPEAEASAPRGREEEMAAGGRDDF